MANDFERSCVRSYVDHKKLRSLRGNLVQNDNLELQADIFAMLGDLTRLKILTILSKTDELCVCDVADVLDMDVSAISHQLRRLKDRGFVKNRRDGVTLYYRLATDEAIEKTCSLIDEIFQKRKKVEYA